MHNPGPTLAVNVQTRWGYYTAGTPVNIIETMGDVTAVCFDLLGHHNNKCHWKTIPTTAVTT